MRSYFDEPKKKTFTDQPKKKAFFLRFATEHPLREIFFFSRRKIKITYFAEGFTKKAAFACHKGLFEFNIMPFGLSNGPAVFQDLMSVILQGCNDFATAYLDDIMEFISTLEEHFENLSIILAS